jgi:hypothetical protein
LPLPLLVLSRHPERSEGSPYFVVALVAAEAPPTRALAPRI